MPEKMTKEHCLKMFENRREEDAAISAFMIMNGFDSELKEAACANKDIACIIKDAACVGAPPP